MLPGNPSFQLSVRFFGTAGAAVPELLPIRAASRSAPLPDWLRRAGSCDMRACDLRKGETAGRRLCLTIPEAVLRWRVSRCFEDVVGEEGYFLSERIEAKPGDLIVFVWLVIESGVGTEGGVGKRVRSNGRLCDVTIRSVLPQSELPHWTGYGLARASGQPVYNDPCGPVNRPLVMARCRISKRSCGGLRGLD